jgi:sulfhydrogenase subunit beta (sulfur reductase)
MSTPEIPRIEASVVVAKPTLARILTNLQEAGFTLVGPTRGDDAIQLGEISGVEDLPRGWTEEYGAGYYRLKKISDSVYFAYGPGPHSWKRFLYPAQQKLLTIKRNNGQWAFEPVEERVPRYAFIGMRSCDVSAIGVLDRVFLGGEFRDPHYARRRAGIFILTVWCTHAATTCFCASMKTGPQVQSGFDLAFTEMPDKFLVRVGSEVGAEMLAGTDWVPASAYVLGQARKAHQQSEKEQKRQIRTEGLPKALYDNLEHPRWEQVGRRCLSCGNCTLACPTCFCSTVEDTSNLNASECERTRVWDSCFTLDFSHVNGGNTRPATRARYRQWLTHKLASWIDQFGVSGCVGCGRCITWCPVGIDITEEAAALMEKPATSGAEGVAR